MIVTDLKHISGQCPMTDGMIKAVEFLRLRGIHELPDGEIEIDSVRVYAIVQRYETSKMDVPRFEYHQKYIDVQYIVSGEEIIGWSPAERIKVLEAYDGDKDICFGAATGVWTPVYVRAGQMAVLYPEDGHAPRLAAGFPSRVMKIVVKVAV
ncbi:MAG TPA: YhcH/YjgK/YiaL family protein [Nitrospirota bacterium]